MGYRRRTPMVATIRRTVVAIRRMVTQMKAFQTKAQASIWTVAQLLKTTAQPDPEPSQRWPVATAVVPVMVLTWQWVVYPKGKFRRPHMESLGYQK